MNLTLANIVVLILAFSDFVVSACYAFTRDWPRSIYWLSAGVIGITTIYFR